MSWREAQKTAVTGHRAAHEAFLSGMSEFDINRLPGIGDRLATAILTALRQISWR